jgi:hypothetical protein
VICRTCGMLQAYLPLCSYPRSSQRVLCMQQVMMRVLDLAPTMLSASMPAQAASAVWVAARSSIGSSPVQLQRALQSDAHAAAVTQTEHRSSSTATALAAIRYTSNNTSSRDWMSFQWPAGQVGSYLLLAVGKRRGCMHLGYVPRPVDHCSPGALWSPVLVLSTLVNAAGTTAMSDRVYADV